MNDSSLLIQSVDVPQWRLRISFAAMAVAHILAATRNLTDGFGGVLFLMSMLSAIFLAWLSVYHWPRLGLWWGWLHLVACVFVLVSLIATVLTHGHLPKKAPPVKLSLALVMMLVNGYLLVLDPAIRQYRHALRTRVGP